MVPTDPSSARFNHIYSSLVLYNVVDELSDTVPRRIDPFVAFHGPSFSPFECDPWNYAIILSSTLHYNACPVACNLHHQHTPTQAYCFDVYLRPPHLVRGSSRMFDMMGVEI